MQIFVALVLFPFFSAGSLAVPAPVGYMPAGNKKFLPLKEHRVFAQPVGGAHVHFESSSITSTLSKDFAESCRSACGLGVDASCAAECETALYRCYEKQDQQELETCKAGVLAKAKGFKAAWEAKNGTVGNNPNGTTTHLANRHHGEINSLHATKMTAEFCEEASSSCRDACRLGVDGSCITECEQDMYNNCYEMKPTADAGPGAEAVEQQEYEACKAKVLEKYSTFKGDWEEKHGPAGNPYGTTTHLASRTVNVTVGEFAESCEASRDGRNLTADLRKEFADGCRSACGLGVDGSCITDCETDMYHCYENKPTADAGPGSEGARTHEYEKCKTRVLQKYRSFKGKWEAKHGPANAGNNPNGTTTHLALNTSSS